MPIVYFNDAIIQAYKITRDKACIGGYNGIEIDSKFYVSTFQFKSNRSKCYNTLVNYLQENQIPYEVEKVHLRWGKIESKEIHVSIFKYEGFLPLTTMSVVRRRDSSIQF
jgi:hypothetical protein